jgi:hypothetical protein
MILFTVISMFTLLLTNNTASVWRLLILFQAAVISFIIDRYTKNFLIFIALHLPLIALYLLITDDLFLRVIYCLFIFSFGAIGLALHLKDKIMNTPLAFCVIFLAMYSVGRYTFPEEIVLSRFFFYLAIAYGMLYILNKYYINLYIYLQKNKDKANIPLKQIKSSNRIYVMGFIYLSFITMLAFTKFPTDKIISGIGNLIVRFLRMVFFWFTSKPQEEYTPPEAIPKLDDMYNINQMPIVPDQRHSEFWEFVYRITVITFSAAIAVLVASLLFYGLYRVYKLYYKLRETNDSDEQVEIISPFSKSGLNLFEEFMSRHKKFGNLFAKSYNDKIRRQYMKAIQKHTKEDQILKYDTPAQLSQYAVDQDEKQAEAAKKEKENNLTALYEKARYSNEECSREDDQAVKKLLK